jgi:tetratricopeptide (TPR) repeat protein
MVRNKNKNIPPIVDSSFFIALAWERKGKFATAKATYLKCLTHHPEHLPALKNLGNLMVRLGSVEEAIGYYEKALELDPQDRVIAYKSQYLKELLSPLPSHSDQKNVLSGQHNTLYIPENSHGKINLYRQKSFTGHRSGWNYAMNALRPLHNSKGVFFDGFIENNFAWKHASEWCRSDDVLEKMKVVGTFSSLATSEEKGIVPYKEPWVGFVHNPQGMPEWFHYQESPQAIFSKNIWKESLEHCLGLLTFSKYHAQWLRKETGKPVSCLVHPTESPDIQFDFEKFIKNPQKKILQVGWWLRKLHSIYRLPIPKNNVKGYEKIRLVPSFFHNADAYLKSLMEKEREQQHITIDQCHGSNTREILHVPDRAYDELLSENIVFIELYDANANNAVLECIARTTPILINPLPAVKEYLGEGYPLYYDSLDEAAKKALDFSLLFEAHQYLKTLETRSMLDGTWFLKSFENSEVYQLL